MFARVNADCDFDQLMRLTLANRTLANSTWDTRGQIRTTTYRPYGSMFTDPLPARSKPAPRHYQIPIIAAFWLADSSAVRYDHREHGKTAKDGQPNVIFLTFGRDRIGLILARRRKEKVTNRAMRA